MGKEAFELKNFEPSIVFKNLDEQENDFLKENIVIIKRKNEELQITFRIDIADANIFLFKILNKLLETKEKGNVIVDYLDSTKKVFFSRKYEGVALASKDYTSIFDHVEKNSNLFVYKLKIKFIYDFYKDFYN